MGSKQLGHSSSVLTPSIYERNLRKNSGRMDRQDSQLDSAQT
jgi:hypothetical protein